MTTINAADIVAQVGAPLSTYLEYDTFIPIISGETSAGVGTYTLQAGFYHKIGKLVFVVGSITWTAHTGTGNMLFSNLPFAVRNVVNYDPECAIRTDSIAWPAASTMVFGEFITGQTYGQIHGIRTAGSVQLVQMSASGTIHFSGFYLT